jgi:hypothetical protein
MAVDQWLPLPGPRPRGNVLARMEELIHSARAGAQSRPKTRTRDRARDPGFGYVWLDPDRWESSREV